MGDTDAATRHQEQPNSNDDTDRPGRRTVLSPLNRSTGGSYVELINRDIDGQALAREVSL